VAWATGRAIALIPAKAGIQRPKKLGPSLRGDERKLKCFRVKRRSSKYRHPSKGSPERVGNRQYPLAFVFRTVITT
jgi:hypothetical protein